MPDPLAKRSGVDAKIASEVFLNLNAPRGLTTILLTHIAFSPGIVAGGLLAFSLSIDDLIITSIVAGQSVTIPLGLRRRQDGHPTAGLHIAVHFKSIHS